MAKKPLISKGDIIKSRRTSKKLRCYNIMPVYVGDKIIRYIYSFVDETTQKFRSINHIELENMLTGVWAINNEY